MRCLPSILYMFPGQCEVFAFDFVYVSLPLSPLATKLIGVQMGCQFF